MKLVLIKYNAGNIQSVLYALDRLGVSAEVTDDAEKIMAADKVIFPGVGEASSAMRNLQDRGLDAVLKKLKQPVLGICVGMQLLCAHSEENDIACLNIVPVPVKKFSSGKDKIKIPQMGWNTIYDLKTPLFQQVPEDSFIYNVHSFYAEDSAYTIARCDYGVTYAAAVQKDNFYGVQFHTEKSATVGEQIIKNFLAI
jgi:imidazole glycerol-phosphate synthase subunit HisH